MIEDTIRHLIRTDDLSRSEILELLERAEWHRTQATRTTMFQGRVAGLLFLQPSTRTRIGFQVAMARLGGTSVEIHETKYEEGMDNAETLSDTIRAIGGYCDILIMRHSSFTEVKHAAEISQVPIINGASGIEHHPTQALIDLYAILRKFGKVDGIRIGLVGDLGNSRCARSLLRALCQFAPKEIRLMAPARHKLPVDTITQFPDGVALECPCLQTQGLDVLYMAGLPPGKGELFLTPEERLQFRLTAEHLAQLPDNGMVLCPLPRIDEIDVGVDVSPKASYFSQSLEALFVRMAVLEKFMVYK